MANNPYIFLFYKEFPVQCRRLNIFVQIYVFKPVQKTTVSRVFLLLIIYAVGNGWAKFFPRRTWVIGTRFDRLGPLFHFINPGPFSLKEVRNPYYVCCEMLKRF